MKFTVLRSASLVLLAAFAFHFAQAHGSQGYAPDSYYRITDDSTQATDLSTNSKIRLPAGCIIHVLWFEGEQLAYFQLDNGYTYSMRWADLFKADYLGEGLHIKRPF